MICQAGFRGELHNFKTRRVRKLYYVILRYPIRRVVVVYQCSISNLMYTGDIEALFVLVHAVLNC